MKIIGTMDEVQKAGAILGSQGYDLLSIDCDGDECSFTINEPYFEDGEEDE